MAPDDRDRTFEKALASHLRSGAAQPGCLDAELLAAYHERLLAPEQMMSCKQHIASCVRCQEILAQIEATDDLLIETDRQEHVPENVLTMPVPQETPELVPEFSESAAAAPVAVPPRSARVAQSPWRSKTLHGANWRWLAPAGLLAAGLLVWISFHETAPSEFKLAKNTPPASVPSAAQPSLPLSPSATPSNQPAVTKENAEESTKTGPANASADSRGARANEVGAAPKNPRVDESKQNEREKALPSAVLDQKDLRAGAFGKPAAPGRMAVAPNVPTERDAVQPNLTAAVTPPGDAGSAQDKLMRKQSALAPAPTAPATHKDDTVNAVAANGPPPPTDNSIQAEIAGGRQTPNKAKSETAAVTVQMQSAIVPEAETALTMRMAKARASVSVVAPGSKVLWRVGFAGLIEHSTDAGRTWAVQVTGVVADLLAGSAPSSQICWAVGRSGTILRTTDGGAHWKKIPTPVTDDLLAVFAVDDQQASVSITQASYQTMDGGRTWNKLLPE